MRARLLLLLIPLAVPVLAGPAAVSPAESAAVLALARGLFAARQAADADAYLALWCSDSPDRARQAELARTRFRPGAIRFGDPELRRTRRVQSGGVSCLLRVRAASEGRDLAEGQPVHYNLEARREGDSWRAWRFTPATSDLTARATAAPAAARRALVAEEDPDVVRDAANLLVVEGYRQTDAGETLRALATLAVARDLAEALGDDELIGTAALFTGRAHHYRAEYPQALDRLAEAVRYSRRAGDKLGTGEAEGLIGGTYLRMGELDRALRHYESSRRVFSSLGATRDLEVLKTTLNIAVVEKELGRYSGSLARLEEIRPKLEALGDAARDDRQVLMHAIGNIYIEHGNLALAERHYEDSLAMSEQAGDVVGAAQTLHNLGLVDFARGEHEGALRRYGESETRLRSAGDRGRAHLPSVLNSRGRVYLHRRQIEPAVRLFRESEALCREIGDSAGLGVVLVNLAEAHRIGGDLRSALTAARDARAVASRTRRAETLWNADHEIGTVHLLSDRPVDARRAFLQAIAAVESLREQSVGEDAGLASPLQDRVRPYHGMLHTYVAQHRVAEAFAWSERARSRVLLDVIRSGRKPVHGRLSEDERAREAALQQDVLRRTDEVAGHEPGSAGLAESIREQKAAVDRLEAFRAGLYARYPELRMARGEARPITLVAARALIPDRSSALLEFAVTETATYLFVFDRAGPPAMHTIAVTRAALAGEVEAFRREIAARSPAVSRLAGALYRRLLGAAAGRLRHRRLLIVPDGPLWELPFQALSPEPGRWLLDRCEVSLIPSVTVLAEMRRRPAPARSQRVLLVGDAPLTAQAGRLAQRLDGAELRPIPGAARQLDRLRSLYGRRSIALRGAAATEERIAGEAAGAGAIHFATHGIAHRTRPMHSHLLVAAGPGGRGDGRLEAREVMDFQVPARLTVLAACESARGLPGAGEGLLGLTWAFFVAGCPRTVAGQWQVREDSTTLLMTEFHRSVRSWLAGRRGAPGPAASLRVAALAVRRAGYSHPFYWAPFVLVGPPA